jgi:hypothetical protein
MKKLFFISLCAGAVVARQRSDICASGRQFAETINQSGPGGLILFLSQRNQKLASGKQTQ